MLVEIGMIAAPGEFAELVVGRTAENDGVAVGEFLVETAELGDLGRADEGEIFRVEIDDFPLVREARLRDFLELRNAFFFVRIKSGFHTDNGKIGKLVADA